MKSFLARLLVRTAAILLSLVLTFGVLFLAFAALGALLSGPQRVPADCVVIVDLDAPIGEYGQRFSLARLFGGSLEYPLPAHEAAAALRRAARDERVGAVLLTGSVRGNTASLGALRSALDEVRAAQKPVLAYYSHIDERGLWFASAADEVWLEPLCLVEFDGWAVDVPYLGEALERYGVGVQVVRVGDYKSAAEFLRSGRMSAEEREQMEHVLGGLADSVLAQLGAARDLERSALDALMAERGYLDARDAVDAGLADRTAPFGDLLQRLRERMGLGAQAELAEMDLAAYARARVPRSLRPPSRGAGLLVVPAEGEIVDGSSAVGIGGEDLARRLREARHDEEVSGVVLRVNSPGGSATASEVIRVEVEALRAAGKPVVVSMGAVAASGGYWISASADRIVAEPETITGSIGVIGLLIDIETLAERLGVRAERVSTSPLANTFSPWQRSDEGQVAAIQSLVDRIYEDFLDRVAAGRGMQREAVHAVAQGRVWTGARALELGLVDELGDLEHAVAVARGLAGLGQDAPVRYARPEREWLEALLSDIALDDDGRLARARGETRGAGPGGQTLARDLFAGQAWLERLERLLERGPVLARLPFDIDLQLAAPGPFTRRR